MNPKANSRPLRRAFTFCLISTLVAAYAALVLPVTGYFHSGGTKPSPDSIRLSRSVVPRGESGGAAPETGRTQRLATPDQTPEGLSTGDWSGIREAYEAGRRRVYERAPGAWTARNPGQQMAAEFDGHGANLATDGGTRLGLKLAGYGFSDKTTSVGAKARRVNAVENRVEYVWDDKLTEWFVNDERGFEQGWTLASAPSDATRLRLDVAVSGGLRAKVVDAVTVNLTDGRGVTALTYGGLKAWDATGKDLAARFDVESGNRIGIVVETAGAVYPVTVDPLVQQAYLKASNTGAGDNFGRSVAVSGDTVVVGASGEGSAATGVNGNQADNSATQSGAAYVFVRNGTMWSQQAYLKASNTNVDDQFGFSVAVAGDTVVVGALQEASAATGVNGNQADNSAINAGAAYVFVRNGTMWSQQAYLKASNTDANDLFGWSVAVAGDTVVVGALGEGSAATGVNGNQVDNSALSSGAAYVFVRSGGVWSQQAYLKASNTGGSDLFGLSVTVAGDTVVVGAPFESSAATGVNGNQEDNSAPNSGAAYVFVRSGGVWSQQAYLKASNTDVGDYFGFSVAVAGDTVVVGAWQEDSAATGGNGNQADNSAPQSGAAYVFVRSGGVWGQQAYLKASNTDAGDGFGYSVAVAGDRVVIAAVFEGSNATGVNGNQADNSASSSGAAYVFVRSGGVWNQQAYLKASNTGAFDRFGESVAVSGDRVVVGAPGEDSNAINGNQADNSATDSGAAYIFVPSLTELPRLYVADTDNSRIQVFDGTTWSLAPRTTGVVGSAAGQFRSPEGVTATQTGQIYVADTGNNRIHWFTGFTWIDFATIGSALNQVRAPQAVAVDSTGQFLFVADTGNSRILRFAAGAPGSAGVVLANAGNFPGQVNGPRGLAVDSLGNLFVADTGNSRILRIANATTAVAADTGTIVTSSLRVPEGVALDNEGNLYIADTGNSRILQLPGGMSGTPVTLATLGTALGSVRSAEGVTVTSFASGPLAGRYLLVGDTINNRIQARPLAGGAWSLLGGTGSAIGQFRSPSKLR